MLFGELLDVGGACVVPGSAAEVVGSAVDEDVFVDVKFPFWLSVSIIILNCVTSDKYAVNVLALVND